MTINWCGRSFRFWMVGAPSPNRATIHFFLLIYGREFMAALGPRNRLNSAAPGLCLDAAQIADIISYWQ